MIKSLKDKINEDYFSKLANRKETGDIRRENGNVKETLPNGKKVLEDEYNRVHKALFQYNLSSNDMRVVDIADDGKLMIEWLNGDISIGTNNAKDCIDEEGNLICYIVNEDKKITISFTDIPKKGLPKKTKHLTLGYVRYHTLEGLPEEVTGNVEITNCRAMQKDRNGEFSFGEFFPKTIGGNIYISDCLITSLYGLPEEIGGNVFINTCYSLLNLKYLPKKMNVLFNLENKNVYYDNLIKSLNDVDITFNSKDSHICIKNLDYIVNIDGLKSNCNHVTLSYDSDRIKKELMTDSYSEELVTKLKKNLKNLEVVSFCGRTIYKNGEIQRYF